VQRLYFTTLESNTLKAPSAVNSNSRLPYRPHPCKTRSSPKHNSRTAVAETAHTATSRSRQQLQRPYRYHSLHCLHDHSCLLKSPLHISPRSRLPATSKVRRHSIIVCSGPAPRQRGNAPVSCSTSGSSLHHKAFATSTATPFAQTILTAGLLQHRRTSSGLSACDGRVAAASGALQ